MITPDPNLPDHGNTDVPVEPISWTLDRIEAMGKLYDDAPICPAGCNMEREIIAMNGELPKALSYGHERSCQFAEA